MLNVQLLNWLLKPECSFQQGKQHFHISKHHHSFFYIYAAANSNTHTSYVTSQDAVERAQQMKKELLDKLEKLSEDLPPNTLDELIDELGGPENVAEVGAGSQVTVGSRAVV